MKHGKNYWPHSSLKFNLLALFFLEMGSFWGPARAQIGPPFAWQQINRKYQVTCLVYHRFGDPRYPSTNTPEATFEAHLKYLQQKGFKSYTVTGLLKDTTHLVDAPKKLLITVDDGFASFLEKGVPLLGKYKMKATLFINTQSVGWSDYLSWDQLRELRTKGVEIGSHSHEHTYFVNLPKTERARVFEEDLLKAEALFQEHLGFVPKIYVYPYGEFLPDLIEVLKKHGYRIAFGQNSGVMCEASHAYAIPRFPLAGAHVSMDQFISKVNMGPIRISTNNQLPLMVKANQDLTFPLVLTDRELKGSFNCFVAGQPSREVLTKKGDTLTFRLSVPPNRRRTLVTITSRNEDGGWHWFSKLLINGAINEEAL